MNGSEREPAGAEEAGERAEGQHAQIVREGFRFWNENRLPEALERFWHPQAVVYHPEGWPEPGPSIGRAAAASQFERVREDFDVDRLEILELLEIEDRVVLRMRWFARGRGSGVDGTIDMSGVYWFDDGLIVRNAFFWDHQEALTAAEE